MNFSIIIPTKNRYQALRDTLSSLAKVDFPTENYEIIVIDNNSNDKTLQTLQTLIKKIRNLRFFKEENAGVSFARNKGIKHARFKHLIFIDDDVKVQSSFLKGYELAWQKYPKAAGMGGRIIPFFSHASFSQKQKNFIKQWDWCFSLYDKGTFDRELCLGELVYGPNMSLKKDKSKRIFDTHLGKRILNSYCLKAEEYELCTRLILQGENIMYIASDAITVKHLVQIGQFNPDYIMTRHYFAGVEHFVMDTVLIQKFPYYQSFYKSEIKLRLKQLLSLKWKDSIHYFLSKYRAVQMLSYFLNGKYFYKP